MSASKKILFVDDDENVLAGLQRMLRPRRSEWDMRFVSSAEEALRVLEGGEFNVVVSDMRMPGMDGCEFLQRVAQQYPDMVRIILSGQSDRDILLKSVELAHQFLAKPCDADSLKATIENASSLRALLKNDTLRSLVSRIDSLPSLPVNYMRLLEELRSRDASVERAGAIISSDMAMTARILQLANSAFFGLRQRVSDPKHAVSLLGLETIRALVLSAQVFRQFDHGMLESFSPERLWGHSVMVGAFAQAIARAEGKDHSVQSEALMAGLMHDIGKLVLAAKFPREWLNVLRRTESERAEQWEIEHRVFGAGHPELGGYLLGLWGLADPVVETLAYHHEPSRTRVMRFGALTAVHAANVFEHRLAAQDGVPPPERLDADYLGRLGLAGRTEAWLEMCGRIKSENPQWKTGY